MFEFLGNITGLKRASLFDCFIGVAGGFLIPIFSFTMMILVSSFTGGGESESSQEVIELLQTPIYVTVVIGLLMGVIIPIVEELIFRGFMWYGLSWITERKWFLVMVTSIIFILAHQEPQHMLGVTPIAFFMGILRAKSGSVIPTMLTHMVNNTFVFVFLYTIFGV